MPVDLLYQLDSALLPVPVESGESGKKRIETALEKQAQVDDQQINLCNFGARVFAVKIPEIRTQATTLHRTRNYRINH
ncbi:hypothetical protein AB833_00500 [Chromatiales bacterium (ex Bugula neritina AB1)]|nr:hypothetical protein AB833_00500 [Chromatiales bacterium (ex Bugula neritina AB1)]